MRAWWKRSLVTAKTILNAHKKSKLVAFSENSDHQDPNAGNKNIELHIDYFNKEENLPIETLMVGMKSVVIGKYEFEYRD